MPAAEGKTKRRPVRIARLPDRQLWDIRPGQQLLTPAQTAARFGISRARFYDLVPYLVCTWGMKRVKVRKSWRYVESSIDQIILTAAQNDTPICPPDPPPPAAPPVAPPVAASDGTNDGNGAEQ